MARRFHPDKNIGLDTTKMMTMINTAKYGFLDQLSDNDQVSEEENFQAAEDRNKLHLIKILIQNQAIHHPN